MSFDEFSHLKLLSLRVPAQLVEMIRKLLLTGCLLFVGPSSMFQLAVGMIVASIFLAMMHKELCGCFPLDLRLTLTSPHFQ